MTAKKPNLAAALNNVNSSTQAVVAIIENHDRPQSRQGKKAISGFFDPVVSKQLKQLALDGDTTVQALLAESLNDLFVKHGHKPIA